MNVFHNLTLKLIIWKTKTLFKKLEYRFLVESTKIEKATFPYKTALLEANIKINRMRSAKWTHHKQQKFASNYFIFSKTLFQSKNLVSRVDSMYQPLNCPYSYFSIAFGVLFEGACPVRILNVGFLYFSDSKIYLEKATKGEYLLC